VKPDFEVDERWEVVINFTDEVMPRHERVSGYADNTEMFKLYWYKKSGPKTYAEFIPMFTIKSVEIRPL
jgi:hypothetical protein